MQAIEKKCSKCQVVKPVSEFSLLKGKPKAECKRCACKRKSEASQKKKVVAVVMKQTEAVERPLKSTIHNEEQNNRLPLPKDISYIKLYEFMRMLSLDISGKNIVNFSEQLDEIMRHTLAARDFLISEGTEVTSRIVHIKHLVVDRAANFYQCVLINSSTRHFTFCAGRTALIELLMDLGYDHYIQVLNSEDYTNLFNKLRGLDYYGPTARSANAAVVVPDNVPTDYPVAKDEMISVAEERARRIEAEERAREARERKAELQRQQEELRYPIYLKEELLKTAESEAAGMFAVIYEAEYGSPTLFVSDSLKELVSMGFKKIMDLRIQRNIKITANRLRGGINVRNLKLEREKAAKEREVKERALAEEAKRIEEAQAAYLAANPVDAADIPTPLEQI